MVDHGTSRDGNAADAEPGGRTGDGAAAASPETIATAPVNTDTPNGRDSQFEAFYRAHYTTLIRHACYAGADLDDAYDAVAATMEEVYISWERLDDPLNWARRAVVRTFVRTKTRLAELRARMIKKHGVLPTAFTDTNLTKLEEWQWVKQLLISELPTAQQQVMSRILDGNTPKEIAAELKTEPATVRQRLSQGRRRLAEAVRRLADLDDEDRG